MFWLCLKEKLSARLFKNSPIWSPCYQPRFVPEGSVNKMGGCVCAKNGIFNAHVKALFCFDNIVFFDNSAFHLLQYVNRVLSCLCNLKSIFSITFGAATLRHVRTGLNMFKLVDEIHQRILT